MKRFFFLMATIFLVISIFAPVGIQSIKAQPTLIYIKADGTIDPIGAPITTSDQVTYYLINNISDSTIVIQRSNIILDGNGFTLQGYDDPNAARSRGIELSGVNHVTIQDTVIRGCRSEEEDGSGIYFTSLSNNNIITNNSIKGCDYGIKFDWSNNNNAIIENDIDSCGQSGIYVNQSSGNKILRNEMKEYNWYTIRLSTSSNNIISENNFTTNWGNILLEKSSNNTISKNNITDLHECAIILQSSSNNKILENTFKYVNRGSVSLDSASDNNYVSHNYMGYTSSEIYIRSSSNNIISENELWGIGYAVIIHSSSNITINGNHVDGIYFSSSTGTITNNSAILIEIYNSSRISIYGNSGDISLTNCQFNNILGNNIYMFSLSSSSNNSISGNTIDSFRLSSSPNNTISGNTINLIDLRSSSNNTISRNELYRIYVYQSTWNKICSNNITNKYQEEGSYGICLVSSNYNMFSENIIKNYYNFGIELDNSAFNKIYHNNFENNAQQVYIKSTLPGNMWDDGYPSGGNIWSDYSGSDLYSGLSQNILGSDGIGDTPYIIDGNNIDRYPLVGPYSIFTFTVSASPSQRQIGAGKTATYTITTTCIAGDAEEVSLSVSGLPAGATATFNPRIGLAGFSSTMSIATSKTTPSGVYSLMITGKSSSITSSTSVRLTVLPSIVSFTTSLQDFSPNGDGGKDDVIVKASFSEPLAWTLMVKDSADQLVTTWSGTGVSFGVIWDGLDRYGNTVPDGAYKFVLSGRSLSTKLILFSSGTRTVVVDTVGPTVTDVSVSPSSFNPSLWKKATIKYTLLENCYVYVRVYSSAGKLVRTLLSYSSQAAGARSVVWNGKNSVGSIVPAGVYTIKISVEDKAGNKAATYPIITTVTVN